MVITNWGLYMNFQQLRILQETIRSGLNLTDAANSLYASQSGVSKQIKELELELGVKIFVRHGKRITGLTTVGHGVAEIADKILLEAQNLKNYSRHYINAESGKLRIATTHNQARHILPEILTKFSAIYPQVSLDIKQVTPLEAERLLIKGDVDIAIATEALENTPDVLCFSGFKWNHIVIVKKGHPLEEVRSPTIFDISQYPIVTYSNDITGRSKIDKAFQDVGIQPDIRFTTLDSDVIKTYVEVGLGIGIISEMALHEIDQNRLRVIKTVDSIFEENVTKLALKRGELVRKYLVDFSKLIVPILSDKKITYSPKIASDLEKILAIKNDNIDLPDYNEWRNIYLSN